ncbi:unnamed protein product [Tetraodon nigroviridis]|uniref:(spotted green pufferfish) hypothetical protein n=1 Tax=Tetraodon nigroviridis TaxID=99883 RepID=Q4SI85_TETNG|nr:unnamed protein product [Tetraodon nigroviridis]
MTANKSSKAVARAGDGKAARDIPDRSQSTSPCPVLSASQPQGQPSFLGDGESGKQTKYIRTDGRFLVRAGWNNKTASLCNPSSHTSESDSQGRLTKSKSISCLDNRLSIYKPQAHHKSCQESPGCQEQKEKQGDLSPGDGRNGRPLSWSTLSLGSSSGPSHKRTLSLPRSVAGVPPTTIRRKISEWECRRVSLPKMSLCLDKRVGERVGGSEGCPSLLSSPCSEKNFDFKGVRRMSTAFSECSYTEEEEVVLDRDGVGRFQKRTGKSETSGTFVRSMSARKETSAVLNRIQKIEQSLKENPSLPPPRYLNNCYAPDKTKQKSFIIGDDFDSTCASKRSSVCSVATEPDPVSGLSKLQRQRFSMSSARSESPEPPSSQTPVGTPVNPLPKPKRTFEYDAKGDQKCLSPANGLPPSRGSESPPPLPSTPAPSVTRTLKTGGSSLQDREPCESEDATSLLSSHPSSPKENGRLTTQTRSRPNSKSTLEENAYEDIVGKLPKKENPYEDVDLKRKSLWPKVGDKQILDRGQEAELSASVTLQTKQPVPPDRKSHRTSQLIKRYSHDEMLLLPQLGVSGSACGLLDDSLCSTGDTLASHRHWRIPKLVQRINSIYCTKRGKKKLKKLSMSSVETTSLRDDNSESESDSDDRFKAHTQRLLKLQSILRRAPSYRTLELQLIEWQERELFEYFVVVSLKKKPSKNSYFPEVTYQFPKLERPTKQMREAEQRLKAIPQFCFPDAKDWSPVSDYTSETFSFMLTGEDGSRRFGYCRRLLPTGKGPRLPEVYCVISRLGCFDLFSTILDEVERRRGVSAALVYPFMRSLMESPFPAPGKLIKVKTFLPGAGNEVRAVNRNTFHTLCEPCSSHELHLKCFITFFFLVVYQVIELRRPSDSRLEHVNFDSLFSCLSVRQVIRVFASLLLERRVIFVADKLSSDNFLIDLSVTAVRQSSTLSSCMHAVVALLYPFSWQHTFIPVLPGSMLDIVCCPTPFLVGLLSSSLPKLKDLPVEEALMVDLGTDRFIRQMDDEASLLPRKLQAALEQALEQRNDIISQDSDSESDEEYNSLNSLVSEAFIRFFLETIGHYSLFIAEKERGERVFQREAFRKSVASKSIRRFLGVFMESQMFAGFIQDRELRKTRAKGLFEQRVEQYLEELPDTEQSGVNKFLKGLGEFCSRRASSNSDSARTASPWRRVVQTGKALQDQQWLFESLMVQVEERRSAVENSAKQIEDRLHGVTVARRKAENQIKMAKMIMMNELNKRANLLIEQLEKISEDFQQHLEDQLQGAIDACSQLDHVQKFITWALTHHCRGPVLFSRSLISFQMQQLLDQSLGSDSWSPPKIKFNWDASYWTKQISSFGQLTAEGGNCTYPPALACSSILRPQPVTCLSLPPVCHRGREPGYGYQACCEPQRCCLHGIPSQSDLSSLDKNQLDVSICNSSCIPPAHIAAPLHQNQQPQRYWDRENLPQLHPSSSPVPVLGLNCSRGSTAQPQVGPSQPQSLTKSHFYHQSPAEADRSTQCQGKLSPSAGLPRELTAADAEYMTEEMWEDRCRLDEPRGQTLRAGSRELVDDVLLQRDGRETAESPRSTSLEVSVTTCERGADMQSSRISPSLVCTRKQRSQSIPAELSAPSTGPLSERLIGCTGDRETRAADAGPAGAAKNMGTIRSLTAPPYGEYQKHHQSATHAFLSEPLKQGRKSSQEGPRAPTDLKYAPQRLSALEMDSDSDPNLASEGEAGGSPGESSSEAELQHLAEETSAAAGGTGPCTGTDTTDSEPSLEYEGDPESDPGAGSEGGQEVESAESDVQPDCQAETDSEAPPPDSQGSVESEIDVESELEPATDEPQPLRSDLEEDSHMGPGQRPLLMANPVAQRGPEDSDDTGMESEDFCAVCLIGGDLLCCDRCPKVFHLSCHVPPLLSFPSGDWVCSLCREVEYDCENERTSGEQRLGQGLSAGDQRKCERLTLLILSNILSAPFHEPVSPLVRSKRWVLVSQAHPDGTALIRSNHGDFPAGASLLPDHQEAHGPVRDQGQAQQEPRSALPLAGPVHRRCLSHVSQLCQVQLPRLGGGPGGPQSGGVLHLAAQTGFSRPSVPCGPGGLRQRRVRRGLQGSGGRFPLAREEGAVPQKEEEEKFPQVQKTQLLTRQKRRTAMDTHVLLGSV